jgi:uncharacterized protein (DUF1015 family)
VLVRDPPCYYVYRDQDHVQTVGTAASVGAYDANASAATTHASDKEETACARSRRSRATGRCCWLSAAPAVDAMLLQACGAAPATDITADDGVRHTLWPVGDATTIERLAAAFDAMPALYIADGHHRSAAASRVAAARRAADPRPEAEHGCDGFLAVAFPHHQMRILDYNRTVKDLNGNSARELLAAISAAFQVEASETPVKPARHGEFGLYLPGQWVRLRIKPALAQPADPVRRLDVSLLADHLLQPILHIADPRTDERIDFVGGVRGCASSSGAWTAADGGGLLLYPTRMEDLMAVADSGQVMPPKSTWFEPSCRRPGLAPARLSRAADAVRLRATRRTPESAPRPAWEWRSAQPAGSGFRPP